MNNFTIQETGIEGAYVIRSKVFGDERGFFCEMYNERSFASIGLDVRFVQDNRSRSRRGTLRGMHFQRTKPQGKLVSVLSGSVFDAFVDLREGSATFGKWFGMTLTDDGTMIYIPPGMAHGFCVVSESADFYYKCTDLYAPEDEGGLAWDDPTVGINWPSVGEPILSEKDRHYPRLADAFRFKKGAV